MITQIVIANTLDNIENFNEVLTAKIIILYCTFFLVLPLILLNRIEIIKDKNRRTFFIIGIFLLIFIAILAPLKHQNRKGAIFAYPPAGLLKSYINYRSEIYTSLKNKPPLLPINDIVKTKISPKKIKNLKVVLIIGESARSKNFSINGYQPDTTPRIKKFIISLVLKM